MPCTVQGYTTGNIQFVCSVVNVMKNKLPEPLFFELCQHITEYHSLISYDSSAL